MSTITDDLQYLQVSLDELEIYLKSSALDWLMPGSVSGSNTPCPNLTPAAFLLIRARLRIPGLSTQEQQLLEIIDQQTAAILGRWRTAWDHKASQEFSMRLDLWRHFLEDYQDAPQEQAPYYRYEVTQRVYLEFLHSMLPNIDSDLNILDEGLKLFFIPGIFIWETAQESVFKQNPYWFLYGTLKSS